MLNLTPDNKNSITLTNEAKQPDITWDEATFTWDEAQGTWDVPGEQIVAEPKNSVSLTYENKN